MHNEQQPVGNVLKVSLDTSEAVEKLRELNDLALELIRNLERAAELMRP